MSPRDREGRCGGIVMPVAPARRDGQHPAVRPRPPARSPAPKAPRPARPDGPQHVVIRQRGRERHETADAGSGGQPLGDRQPRRTGRPEPSMRRGGEEGRQHRGDAPRARGRAKGPRSYSCRTPPSPARAPAAGPAGRRRSWGKNTITATRKDGPHRPASEQQDDQAAPVVTMGTDRRAMASGIRCAGGPPARV